MIKFDDAIGLINADLHFSRLWHMTKTRDTRKGSLCLRGTSWKPYSYWFNNLKSGRCLYNVYYILFVYASDRWRIADDVGEEFNLDARPGSSDAENP